VRGWVAARTANGCGILDADFSLVLSLSHRGCPRTIRPTPIVYDRMHYLRPVIKFDDVVASMKSIPIGKGPEGTYEGSTAAGAGKEDSIFRLF